MNQEDGQSPFDVAGHLGVVTRVVESTEHDGQPAKAIVASRVFATDPEDLWDALTNPERLPRWFLPVTGELKLGGRYQFEGNAGGTVTECAPPSHVALTWEFGGSTSWVSVQLAPEGAGTLLTLRHVAHLSSHWEEYGPGATGVGWEGSFVGLAGHLQDAERADLSPEQAHAWMTSSEARGLYRASSDGWARAAIANGAPESEAWAAGKRTSAFYTGDDAAGD